MALLGGESVKQMCLGQMSTERGAFRDKKWKIELDGVGKGGSLKELTGWKREAFNNRDLKNLTYIIIIIDDPFCLCVVSTENNQHFFF